MVFRSLSGSKAIYKRVKYFSIEQTYINFHDDTNLYHLSL